MIQKISFEEDLELKRFASTPKEKKPRFDWGTVLGENRLHRNDIKIVIGSSADKVGFSNINYKGWLMTDLPWFDIRDLN